jgi:origin recognition complex subunit 6
MSRTLPPHIYAGVSSIQGFVSELGVNKGYHGLEPELAEFLEPLLLTGKQINENDADYKILVLALVVAVYFLVLARRRNSNSGGSPPSKGVSSVSPPQGTANRAMDKKTFIEMRSAALSSVGLPTDDNRHGEDVDSWIALIMDMAWAKGREWFENIPTAADDDEFNRDYSIEDDTDGGEHDEDDDEINQDVPSLLGTNKRLRIDRSDGATAPLDTGFQEHGLLPGLGTMMQDQVDWLSEDRREDFQEWKEDLLKQIRKLE